MMAARVGLLLVLSLSSFSVSAKGWSCWSEASQRYGVPVTLLYSIARVESGSRAHAISKPNSNGTYDIGLMQINSWWLPKLKHLGITKERLLSDACLNLKVGAWILATSIKAHGFNWRGLGAYNARSDKLRAIYARKVVRELKRVQAEGYTDVAPGASQAVAAE